MPRDKTSLVRVVVMMGDKNLPLPQYVDSIPYKITTSILEIQLKFIQPPQFGQNQVQPSFAGQAFQSQPSTSCVHDQLRLQPRSS